LWRYDTFQACLTLDKHWKPDGAADSGAASTYRGTGDQSAHRFPSNPRKTQSTFRQIVSRAGRSLAVGHPASIHRQSNHPSRRAKPATPRHLALHWHPILAISPQLAAQGATRPTPRNCSVGCMQANDSQGQDAHGAGEAPRSSCSWP